MFDEIARVIDLAKIVSAQESKNVKFTVRFLRFVICTTNIIIYKCNKIKKKFPTS